jgi:hypothetical protein
MALVTYIVVVGLHMGYTHKFSPEVLGKTASSGLTAMVLEVYLHPIVSLQCLYSVSTVSI